MEDDAARRQLRSLAVGRGRSRRCVHMLLGGWRPRVFDCGRQTRNERMHKKNRRVGRRRKASNKHPSATCRARRRVASTMRRRPRRPRILASWAESIPRGQARAHAAQASAAQELSPRTSHGARRQRAGRVALTRRRRPRTSRTAASWAEPTHEDKRGHTRLKRAPRKDPRRGRGTARVHNVGGASR